MSSEATIHLFVEEGPDKGRQVSVPEGGARIGRTDNNDIVLNDASLSRFHCRVYFKPDHHLWISDLGSTNETMVNHKSIQDTILKSGDRITIGDTTILVINDMFDAASPAAPPSVAPAAAVAVPASEPAATPAPAVSAAAAEPVVTPAIDLGFGSSSPPPPAATAPPAEPPGGHIDLGFNEKNQPGRSAMGGKKLILVTVGCVAIVGVLAVLKFVVLDKKKTLTKPKRPEITSMEIDYEKVQASRNNIFRYALTLRDRNLAIQVHNLSEGRNVTDEKIIDMDLIKEIARIVQQEGFFTLDDLYQGGISGDNKGFVDLAITINRKTKRSTVENRLEPEKFKLIRERIEEFAENELGVSAIALPPEKLLELAGKDYLNAESLFQARAVKYVNLYRAIQHYKQLERHLKTINEKPDYYDKAIVDLAEARKIFKEELESRFFQAEQATFLKEWENAANQYRIILQMLPERTDERFKKAEQKLVEAERRLRK